MNLAGTCSLTR